MSEKDQRATLEAKDRDELLTIASTLGGKPGSRAKKADVIDMILGLISDAEPAPPKPRRGRPPKAAVIETSEVADEADDARQSVAKVAWIAHTLAAGVAHGVWVTFSAACTTFWRSLFLGAVNSTKNNASQY